MHIIGPPRRPELDQYALKFVIGAIAFSLPFIEMALTRFDINSISASFWWSFRPEPSATWLVLWPRNIFVGFLLAIAAFMLTYNGKTELEMWLTKIASLAACGVAMFPCDYAESGVLLIKYVHISSAVVMYAVLTAFCLIFLRRARAKGHREARLRVKVYAACIVSMAISIGLILYYTLTHQYPKLVLAGESGGLVAFGISWLTASHVLPWINSGEEQKSLVRNTAPTSSALGTKAGPTAASRNQ